MGGICRCSRTCAHRQLKRALGDNLIREMVLASGCGVQSVASWIIIPELPRSLSDGEHSLPDCQAGFSRHCQLAPDPANPAESGRQ